MDLTAAGWPIANLVLTDAGDGRQVLVVEFADPTHTRLAFFGRARLVPATERTSGDSDGGYLRWEMHLDAMRGSTGVFTKIVVTANTG